MCGPAAWQADAVSKRPTSIAIAVVIASLGVTIGLFLYFFGRSDTDDYAGWVFAIWGLQLPMYLATVTASGEQPLGTGRAVAIALPSSIASAFGLFIFGVVVGSKLWEPRFLDLRPLLVAGCAGVATLAVMPVWAIRLLRRVAHPQGLTRVLVVTTVAGILGAGIVAMDANIGSGDVGLWLAILAPLAFTVPSWLVRTSHPASPPPIAPSRVVSG